MRDLLRLKYHMVAIKFFFREEELKEFKAKQEYKTAMRPLTFCHYCAASRQGAYVLLGTKERLGCANAKYVFGWKDFDENEIKSHLKYTRSPEQAERFVKTKPRIPVDLLAFVTAPLHKTPFMPDVIQIVCDVLQTYHITTDYASAFDIHPINPNFMMNAAVCAGAVWTFNHHRINIVPMCSGSYTSGKTEQGEINIYISGDQIERVARRLLDRVKQYGGPSFPHTGETYPGYDVCKFCPLLRFTEGKDDVVDIIGNTKDKKEIEVKKKKEGNEKNKLHK
jgi:uncharacterized protein (DUF169 family)